MLLNNQPMSQTINKKGNWNIPWNKGKWKHNVPKFMGHSITIPRGQFVVIYSYIKKKKEKVLK